MKTLKFISVLALSLLLQGCVGIIVGGRDTTTIKSPSINPIVALEGVGQGSHGTEHTSEWLKSNWGSPASVKTVPGSGAERWTYDFTGHCWVGVMPVVIIPIPLMVPMGREKVVFQIEDGRVISAKCVKWYRAGVLAGQGLEGPFATAVFTN